MGNPISQKNSALGYPDKEELAFPFLQFIPAKLLIAAFLTSLRHCGVPASVAGDLRGGQTRQMELGTQKAAARQSASLLTADLQFLPL